MRVLKAVLLGIFISLVFTTDAIPAKAEQVAVMRTPLQVVPLYIYTSTITANLSFDGDTAKCDGMIYPSEVVDVTITVSLYQQNGSSWTLLDSWSSSATGGNRAYVRGTKTVSSGTYKVVTAGNVGGLEFPTTSVTKTKP